MNFFIIIILIEITDDLINSFIINYEGENEIKKFVNSFELYNKVFEQVEKLLSDQQKKKFINFSKLNEEN